MSEHDIEADQPIEPAGDMADPEEYGGLSIEDDPGGTVDPAELAGTASESDEDVS